MERIPWFCTVTLLLVALFGCGEKANAPIPKTTDNLMDISTWDFGDLDSQNDATVAATRRGVSDQYSIAVATFTGDGHLEAARGTLNVLLMQYPTIGQKIKIRERSRGSVLTYGLYAGYGDARAKSDIAMLRRIPTAQGRPLFAQVLLTKFKPPRSREKLHPNDLWTVRREYPTIVPIYTLEVAVWGDFDSGKFPKTRRRAAAEQYAAELRRKGFEAYFYHNDDSELSSVTVGLFGPDAIEAGSNFYSPDVEAMLSRFPERLVNGSSLREYRNPNNHSLGTKVQRPVLAEVPVD